MYMQYVNIQLSKNPCLNNNAKKYINEILKFTKENQINLTKKLRQPKKVYGIEYD